MEGRGMIMEKLIIYEDNWLNGEIIDRFDLNGTLFDPKINKFCCLGIFLRKNRQI